MYDAQIREPLFDYLDEKYPKNRIFEEKIMGKSRADIVMVLDGSLAGLEIKSDADTYDRLETQVKDYDKFCDYNYIVAGITHEKHVEEHVPEWWGILIVSEEEGKVKIVQKREAGKNRKCKVSQQIKWLWRTELNHILARNYLPAYKAKSKKFVRYADGAELYSMSVSKFMQLAKDAKACYKVNQLVLVNLEIIDKYLEMFHIVEDDFYK